MKIKAFDEYNAGGHLIYSLNYVGAYVRGKTKQQALDKFRSEILQYARWRGIEVDNSSYSVEIAEEKASKLQVRDADSDALFSTEIPPISRYDYNFLKALALKSAEDFLKLYNSIPDKKGTALAPRETFYGARPLTAEEMYEHTKNVNSYYFGEIGVSAQNKPDIYTCRSAGFEALEKTPNFLENKTFEGSGGELWTLRKLCRRFIWHDRIHAKAMYKMTVKLFGGDKISNPFYFELDKK